MLRKISNIVLLVALLVCIASPVTAASEVIPERVESKHWSCLELKDLADKYDASRRVPEGEFVAKQDLAASLLAVLDKVMEMCDKKGANGIPKEDLQRIARLYDALKADLSGYEGYLTRREAIEKILSRPDETKLPFEFAAGVGGFLRGEGVGNFRLTDFSYAPNHAEGRFLYRAKPFVYWHPTDWIDIHAEGQGYGYTGGEHQERNRFSLYQGYVELKTPGRDWLSLKGGRQEFSYGSAFILGPNSFFDGLVFDAARLRVKPVEPLSLDLLLGAYAPPFNNGFLGNMAGAYATYSIDDATSAELYAFRDSGSEDHHVGEYLMIWGGRGTATFGSVSAEAELVYETGKLFNGINGTNDDIDAFGGHVDVTYDADLAGYSNKFFLSYAYGSGSQDSADGIQSSREFRNPNNDTSLVGDMCVIGDLSGLTVGDHHASGLHIYTLGWGIDLTKEVNFSATGRYFVADHVEAGFKRDIGLETDFTLTYMVSDNVSVIVGYDHFITGRFFRDAAQSDDDILYGYSMLQFNLEKSWMRSKKPGDS